MATGTATLTDLATDVDRAVRQGGSGVHIGEAVGTVLAPYLGAPGLLTADQREGDPAAYRQHLLHVADDGAFSIVALVWLPGQVTPIHDHLCWCVVGVHEGQEHETRYRVDDDCLVETRSLVNAPRSVSLVVPPGDIHRVRNAGDDRAISLHVYGADLRVCGTSIRRCYDLPVRPAG
jgi:3-mercaptopropionate dioxygenase